jgi:hypothetical protein
LLHRWVALRIKWTSTLTLTQMYTSMRPQNSDNSLDIPQTTSNYLRKRMVNDIGLRFIERYHRKERHFVFVWEVQGHSQKLCSFLKRDMGFPFSAGENNGGTIGNGQKCPVLVDVVQFVERPEVVISTPIRLHVYDDFLNILPHSTHLSLVSGLLVCGGWNIFADGECCFTGDTLLRRDKFACQIVHRIVEVADGITDDQRKGWREFFGPLDVQNGFTSVRVVFDGKLIRFYVVEESCETHLHLVDVLLGPLDF